MSDFNMPPGVSARDIPGQHDGQDDGGAAFPVPPTVFSPQGDMSFASLGMSLRDYFAAKAMAALIAIYEEDSQEGNLQSIAVSAYQYADAMLKERME